MMDDATNDPAAMPAGDDATAMPADDMAPTDATEETETPAEAAPTEETAA